MRNFGPVITFTSDFGTADGYTASSATKVSDREATPEAALRRAKQWHFQLAMVILK
jgi:hypothetical protein